MGASLTWVSVLCCAAVAQGLTRPPVTYVLDYGKDHLDQADYVEQLKSCPPDLLHLGKDVPFNHGWGPAKTLGGENVAHGRAEDIARIPPAQVAERLRLLKARNQALHAAGVRMTMPYICLMTINGNPQTRTGFWELYDHWDEYAAFGLGPRPKRDPVEWLQQTPKGEPLTFYKYEGNHPPTWAEGQMRLVASVVDPSWRQWMTGVVRNLAVAGFDGTFVDNGNSYRSYDSLTLQKFREYLAGRYPPARLKELFGFESPDKIALPEKLDGLLGAEVRKFWMTEIRGFLKLLGEAGTEALGRPFRIFPNGAHTLPAVKYNHLDCDYTMYELSVGTTGTNTGRVRTRIVENVADTTYNRHVFEYLYPQAVGGRVRALILTRAGYPRSLPHLEMNATAAELGMAEAGAFSGGGGYLLRPLWPVYGPPLAKYKSFFAANQALYEGLEPEGRVAVLASVDDSLLGNTRQPRAAEVVVDLLGGEQVPLMLVTEESCREPALARFDALVLPELKHLPADAARAAAALARAGKPVVIVGAPPKLDEFGQPSEAVQSLATVPGVRRVEHVTELARESWLAPLRLLPASSATRDAVRLMVYRDPAGQRRILHLVNYDVQLGPQPDQVEPVASPTLTLPASWRATEAVVHGPDLPAPVRVQIGPDRTLRLPDLRIYELVEIRAR